MMRSGTRSDEARRIEMEITLEALRRTGAPLGSVLEVGCGTGAQSRILSGAARRLVATEFLNSHPSSHAKGIGEARRRLADIPSISLALADATRLPFRPGSFDMVHSCAVLEHVPDRDETLREMARVVKPSGVVVAIVPTSWDTLSGYFYYYAVVLPRMALDQWKSRRATPARAPPGGSPAAPAAGGLRRMARRLVFPIHGWYPTRREELAECRPSRWRALFRDNGFHIVAAFAVRFPFQQIFPRMFRRTAALTSRVGATPLQSLGSAYVIIARPPSSRKGEPG